MNDDAQFFARFIEKLEEMARAARVGNAAYYLRMAAMAAALLAAAPAESHCYARWYYKTPQAGCPAHRSPIFARGRHSFAPRSQQAAKAYEAIPDPAPANREPIPVLDGPSDAQIRDAAIDKLRDELMAKMQKKL